MGKLRSLYISKVVQGEMLNRSLAANAAERKEEEEDRKKEEEDKKKEEEDKKKKDEEKQQKIKDQMQKEENKRLKYNKELEESNRKQRQNTPPVTVAATTGGIGKLENSDDAKRLLKASLSKVAEFKFKRIIENLYVNSAINSRARYSIPHYYFAYLSQDKKSLRQIEKTRGVPLSQPLAVTIGNTRDQLEAAKEKANRVAAGGDTTDIKSAIDKVLDPNAAALLVDSAIDNVLNVTGPALFDSTGNRVDAEGTRLGKIVEVCIPEDTNENGDLIADRALIKKYLYRTLILLITMYTTLNWVQFLFHKSISAQRGCQENGIGCLITDTLIPDDPAIRFADSIQNIYLIGPIISPIVTYAVKFFWPKFKRYNPLQYTFRLLQTLISYTGIVASGMKVTSDKKIWFLVIFLILIYGNFWFFENYDNYMKQIQRFESSGFITGLLGGAFALFYFESFYLDLYGTISSFLTAAFFVPPIGLIIIICYNIYLFLIMSLNTFFSLFLILQSFLYISLFALFFTPNFSFITSFWKRPKDLFESIRTDGEDKLNAMEPGWPQFLLKNAHRFYDHAYAIVMVLWLMFMLRILGRGLRTRNLRLNAYYYIGLSALILFFLKMLFIYLSKSHRKTN